MFQKIKLYSEYKKIIRENEEELQNKFSLRRDLVNRLYTVIHLDDEIVKQYYPEDISKPYIAKFSTEVDNFLSTKGLRELVALRKVERITDEDYLVVIGYSLFDTAKVARNVVIAGTLLLTLGIFLAIIF